MSKPIYFIGATLTCPVILTIQFVAPDGPVKALSMCAIFAVQLACLGKLIYDFFTTPPPP
jgi:hypothetical protein